MTAAYAASANHSADGGTSRTCNITSSNSNRKLFVKIAGYWSGVTLDAVTYGGVDITSGLIITRDDTEYTSNRHLRVYQVDDPNTASTAVACSFSGAVGDVSLEAITYYDCGTVDAGTPSIGNSTAPSNTISSATGRLCVDFGYGFYNASAVAVVSGETYRVEIENYAGTGAASWISDEAGAASVTMSHTLTNSAVWLTCAISIQEVAAAGNPHYYYAQQ